MAAELIVRIQKAYPAGARIAADLRLDLRSSPVTVLFGPSGAGKTTLLRCLAGLERPDEGVIRWGDETWDDSGRAVHVEPQARRIGYVFQEYALFPHLTVEQNVAYGLSQLSSAKRRDRVEEMLVAFDLQDLRRRRPREISGGQLQRVALARAVAPRPRLLLLDEPLSALDAPTRERFRSELRRRLTDLSLPALVVTHDRTEALALADHLVVIVEGQVRQTGPVEEVFRRPADLVVARSVGIETVVAGRPLTSRAGVTCFQVGSAQVQAVDPGDEAEKEGLLCIRADEVVLTRDPAARDTARNHLPGRIVSIAAEGPVMRVSLDCGFPLAAFVTRQSCEDLGLRESDTIYAVFKATSVHFVPKRLA